MLSRNFRKVLRIMRIVGWNAGAQQLAKHHGAQNAQSQGGSTRIRLRPRLRLSTTPTRLSVACHALS
jgi:hypothetical protein